MYWDNGRRNLNKGGRNLATARAAFFDHTNRSNPSGAGQSQEGGPLGYPDSPAAVQQCDHLFPLTSVTAIETRHPHSGKRSGTATLWLATMDFESKKQL